MAVFEYGIVVIGLHIICINGYSKLVSRHQNHLVLYIEHPILVAFEEDQLVAHHAYETLNALWKNLASSKGILEQGI